LSIGVLSVGRTSGPTIQTGPDAEMTFDGLTRVDNSESDLAWVRADIDLGYYHKVILEGTGVEFGLVDDPGPDVLLIRGALLDVVSRVPPTTSGRSRIFIDSVAEATLVIEVRDSVTKAILARVIDRQAARRPSGAIEVNSVSTWSEVSRLANRWASRLRAGLESIG